MLFLVLVADFFVLVLVFVNGIVIFSFLVIFVFVFVNENHTVIDQQNSCVTSYLEGYGFQYSLYNAHTHIYYRAIELL